mmetsp:Transcript_37085/g.107059  ORF Transcript_37085/g.107059 Transcript_37085/m.107059 type:complete len:224 (+) Transcript_37085:512-1183(+)
MAINIIFIGAKRVRQLHRDAVQHPQNEDLDEREEPRPHGMRRPLRCDKRRDEPMQDQAAVASLGVLRRERRRRQAKGVVVLHHAVPKLLEDPGEQGRRRRQDALLGVLHDVVLYPSAQQLNLTMACDDGVQTLLVQILRRDELVLVVQVPEQARPTVVAAGLELSEGQRVEHADQPDQDLLEVLDLFVSNAAMGDEARREGGGLEPLRVHAVDRGASLPPPGI